MKCWVHWVLYTCITNYSIVLRKTLKRTLLLLKKICKNLQYIVEGKKIRLMLALLDSWLLDAQQAYFKLAMLNNCKQAMEQPSNINSFTLLWHALKNDIICIYPKLIKIDIVHYKTCNTFYYHISLKKIVIF